MEEKLNPYKKSLPEEIRQEQAKPCGKLFKVFLKYKKHLSRVTFWGVTDGDSWKNDCPVRGRTNYPLLFAREGKTKPAFNAILKIAKN